MNDYSYNDVMRMQNEAKQRVMEMQKRSKFAAENFNNRHNDEKKEVVIPKKNENDDSLPRVPKSISYPTEINSSYNRSGNIKNQHRGTEKFDLKKSLASVFGKLSSDDYEKMFIMSLCLLLSKEKGDDSLIFSLMYLIT